MMDTVLNWMYYVCAMLCMISVGEWTFRWTTRDIRKHLFAWGIYIVGFVLGVVLFHDSGEFAIVFFCSEIMAWTLLCEGNVGSKIAKIISIMFGVGFAEAIISIVIDSIVAGMIGEWGNRLLSILFTFSVAAIVTRQRWYQKIVCYLDSLSKGKSIVIICAVIFCTGVASVGNLLHGMIDNRRMTMIFRILIAIDLIVVISIIIWFIIETYQKKYYIEQNHLKEEYIRMQQEYYKTIYEKDSEMRRFRHDVASQMGLLQILLEQGEVDSAKEQLKSIHQEFLKASFPKIQVGDNVLDAILTMMSHNASEKGVRLEVKGALNNPKSYDTYELCTIFSNAINNAVEACSGMQKEGWVAVKILEHNHLLCLGIENPGTEDMYQNILKNETTKSDKDNHGYGITNIRDAVERLNGSMEYRYADGKIELKIEL